MDENGVNLIAMVELVEVQKSGPMVIETELEAEFEIWLESEFEI